MESSQFSRWISENDRIRSATVHHLDEALGALSPLKAEKIERMVDIGCGFGGLPKTVAKHLGIDEVHGIDIDAEVLGEAQEKGIVTHHVDVDKAPLPFTNGYLDLVTSFGMMDYLPFFDSLVREMYRVLRPGGHVLISLPNVASWHNRLMLMLGYQPRDVEVSREILPGVHPWYKGDEPTGHIHTVTPRAFSELMAHHGFETVKLFGGSPRRRAVNPVIGLIDNVLGRRASLARRFFYLGRKPVSASTKAGAEL